MKVLSVNVSLPRQFPIGDRIVSTGIFKTPIEGSVQVRTLNIDGDGQADLSVHGGHDKAVYLYPSEHYPLWERELNRTLEWGAFGENLTVDGLSESEISIGDQLAIGSVILEVTQPRLPCFKLAGKLQRDDIIERLLQSRRTGFYVRVLREGTLQAGNSISIVKQDFARLTIRELTDIYLTKPADLSRIERALAVQALSRSWRDHFNRLRT
jgi:MOSC domain-containing protein YiiM